MAQSAISADAQKNVTWNFNVNLIDVIFITFGFSLISRETVMPVLVSTLTDSKLAIGLIPAIWALGYYLPQLADGQLHRAAALQEALCHAGGQRGRTLPLLLHRRGHLGLCRAPRRR